MLFPIKKLHNGARNQKRLMSGYKMTMMKILASMLHHHVSAVSYNGEIKHWLWRGAFCIFLISAAGGRLGTRGVQLVAIYNLVAALMPLNPTHWTFKSVVILYPVTVQLTFCLKKLNNSKKWMVKLWRAVLLIAERSSMSPVRAIETIVKRVRCHSVQVFK